MPLQGPSHLDPFGIHQDFQCLNGLQVGTLDLMSILKHLSCPVKNKKGDIYLRRLFPSVFALQTELRSWLQEVGSCYRIWFHRGKYQKHLCL